MIIPFSKVCRDYLALRGESPDLLPLLEEGEEGAVLTLADELKVRLPQAALQASLEAHPSAPGEVVESMVSPLVAPGGVLLIRLPSDFLKLCSIWMADWREPVYDVEPSGSLRRILGANAPGWMVCPHRPMVCEDCDADGPFLRVFGSRSSGASARLLYMPRPAFDGETLKICASAYQPMLRLLLETK